MNTQEWYGQWTDQTEVTICDLKLDHTYEYRIRALCDNQEKSAYTYGQFTTETTENPCSNNLIEEETCNIQNIEILKFRKCHDRGTVRPDDDYFIAVVMVAFSNPPGVGQLTLTGNANESISVRAITIFKYLSL